MFRPALCLWNDWNIYCFQKYNEHRFQRDRDSILMASVDNAECGSGDSGWTRLYWNYVFETSKGFMYYLILLRRQFSQSIWTDMRSLPIQTYGKKYSIYWSCDTNSPTPRWNRSIIRMLVQYRTNRSNLQHYVRMMTLVFDKATMCSTSRFRCTTLVCSAEQGLTELFSVYLFINCLKFFLPSHVVDSFAVM